MNPCNVKRLYDTEFEAEVAASKVGFKLDSEMVPYKCGSHWHIANVDKNKRSKVREGAKSYCKYCNCYLKPSRWESHIKTGGHLAKLK